MTECVHTSLASVSPPPSSADGGEMVSEPEHDEFGTRPETQVEFGMRPETHVEFGMRHKRGTY